jgi:hypothetical protein
VESVPSALGISDRARSTGQSASTCPSWGRSRPASCHVTPSFGAVYVNVKGAIVLTSLGFHVDTRDGLDPPCQSATAREERQIAECGQLLRVACHFLECDNPPNKC